LIDVILACEDGNSKLVEVVTVTHVEKSADYNLEGKFGHFFAADGWLWLRSLILVEILKLGLVKI